MKITATQQVEINPYEVINNLYNHYFPYNTMVEDNQLVQYVDKPGRVEKYLISNKIEDIILFKSLDYINKNLINYNKKEPELIETIKVTHHNILGE